MKIVASRSSAWGRSFKSLPRSALAWLAVCLCASCGSVPKTHYYTLRIPPPAPANDPKTNFVLAVDRFRAPETLRDDRIVFYESPTQLNFYQYHRWSSDPATMLSEVVARRLEETGVFLLVRLLPSREPFDYLLKGRLLNFEEIDYEGGPKGRVALELMLVRSNDRKVVWSATRQEESPIAEKGVPGVVNALNASSDQLLRAALPELVAHVEREFTEKVAKNP